MNDYNAALFLPVFPAAWASEWGEDRYGLFMVLVYKGVRQGFRWIAPGTFLMGSSISEPERFEDEIQHEVALTQGFWLADSACTQALWAAVMEENPSRFQGDQNNPVENVNWDDARQFIERLNRMIPDLEARLPTEAQWEYACRAGEETVAPFWFGDNITPEKINYNGNYPYARGAKGLYRQKTVPVKSLPANRWGLYEMHGNVWEWCADWYGDYAPSPAIDPVGPFEGSDRVLRGGSWCDSGRLVRSADRDRNVPAFRLGSIGFRLAIANKAHSGKNSTLGEKTAEKSTLRY